MVDEVVVVIGAGGMGAAIARRLGPGRQFLLADRDAAAVDSVATAMRDEGYNVTPRILDVTDAASVAAIAEDAADLGAVTNVVHTAGVSPTQASVANIFRVDLLGTAHVLDSFGDVVAPRGGGVVVASMAGTIFGSVLSTEDEALLAGAPSADLLGVPVVRALIEDAADSADNRSMAYGIAKRANQLRVQATASRWGARGARLNSISPGVISTPMGRAELADPTTGAGIGAMIANSPTGRVGTVGDIAAIAEFLLSAAAGYITGTDVLADGGVVASMLRPALPAHA